MDSNNTAGSIFCPKMLEMGMKAISLRTATNVTRISQNLVGGINQYDTNQRKDLLCLRLICLIDLIGKFYCLPRKFFRPHFQHFQTDDS